MICAEMIFELENAPEGVSLSEPVLNPLSASIKAPVRRRNRNKGRNLFSETLVSLRSASLPTSSAIRPHLPAAPILPTNTDNNFTREEPEELGNDDSTFTAQDEEILRLVAANTPSHRGAWHKDSESWQTFARRGNKSSHRQSDSVDTSEEVLSDEYKTTDEYHPPWISQDRELLQVKLTWLRADKSQGYSDLVGSLPVAIAPILRKEPILSLASYQPVGALSSTHDAMNSYRDIKSPVSARKAHQAAYAERASLRTLDPGALDFIPLAEEDEDEDKHINGDKQRWFGGDKGRQTAFKIITAVSKEPDAGMWRSLA